ncbi:MAG: type III pantothenate kinase [Planctomycetaceae bacterium]|jgi:type III pantothenate kinase|nr:type III pantothenate kinase [Planctomycetaceae bacterium]
MIALDAGNTRIKIGYYNNGQKNTVVFADAGSPGDALQQVLHVLHSAAETQHWYLAPTNCRFHCDSFIQSVRKVRPNDTFETLTYRQIPLPLSNRHGVSKGIAQPEKIGIDRLLGAYAASVLRPNVPVLAADAGSAVTIDLVRDGSYCGGATVPGLRFLADTFPRISERLMRIDLPMQTIPPYPCCSTEESMLSGLYWTVIGAIRQFAELSGAEAIFLTGGDSNWLYAGLQRYISAERLVLQPDLVLDGINYIGNYAPPYSG